MSNFKDSLRLNYIIGKNDINVLCVISAILGATTTTKSVWMFALVFTVFAVMISHRRILEIAMYTEDAYTYMSFPWETKSIVTSKVLFTGAETLLTIVVAYLSHFIFSDMVAPDSTKDFGDSVYNILFATSEPNQSMLIALQLLFIFIMCFALEAVNFMLVTIDQAVLQNGRYSYMILICMILLVIVLVVKMGYKLTLIAALIQVALAIAVLIGATYSTIKIIDKEYCIKNPIMY